MALPRTVVVVNPSSQGGATGKRWPELAARLRKHFAFEDAMTTGPGDATRLTREALARGAERVVALGGDGTVNEVVNGFFTDGKPVAPTAAFGLIPFGTGGDFRRTMAVSTELDDAAAVIAADHRRPLDVGKISYTTADGGTVDRLFVNICSFGISGVVDRLINQSKKRLGRIGYAIATARATLFEYDNKRVHLKFDDDPATAIDVTINTVAVANGRYFGGAMKIAPDAEVDDGMFDVVCLGDFGKFEVLLKGTRVYKGAHLDMDKVSCRRARVVDAAPVDPGALVELDLDGENVGRLPARFTILPRAVTMVVPVAPASQSPPAPK